MNDKPRNLPTQFGPAISFEVKPVAPFRAAQTSELERLKERLLLQQLQHATSPEQNILLRRAANDALALAWGSSFPLLLFPALFEEKAAAALLQHQRQKRILQRSRELSLSLV